MPSKVRLNVNLDAQLKEDTAAMLERLGMDFTTAITGFFKQIVNKRSIPFEISDTRYYSIEEVAGENWEKGLDKIEDEWE